MLLPYRWKWAGIILVLAGIILAVLYLFFEFSFTMPVFAVFSSFIETKVFTTFQTNFADELVMLTLLTGLALISFSKEKNEQQDFDSIRLRSIFRALMANTAFLIFSILFIFGSGFLGVLVLNVITLHVFYLIFFYAQKRSKVHH